jgi:predicted RNA-binding Zn-ribbon protein involved in translation (DUF1610 family)
MINRDENNNIKPWVCPKCGKETTDFPAISRVDNKTEICSQCGMVEAFADWGKYKKENK